ncbi:solute carrier family 22 member 1-like [Homarus americanus]|uniref:solute carrier family 22 member 1-like n=1 Tax=Homarus americanus TaxID=6706 RepID=UPI001C483A9A|nr:solute carrier family 22 member 1-like [Homarus americanus]XP_042238204.1 solute carrier family 22 member 1-like [Homarus americanus]
MADDIEKVIENIGFGRWQLIHILAAVLGPSALAPALIGSTLTNSAVPYRCRPSHTKNLSDPQSYDNGCFYTSYNNGSILVVDMVKRDTLSNASFKSSKMVEQDVVIEVEPCMEWEYDTSDFTSTVTSEWSLVCRWAWLVPLYQMLVSGGCMLGDVVGGAISDRLGRRATTRWGSVVVMIVVVVVGVSPYLSLVLVARLIQGLALSAIIYPCYNLVMEITPASKRTLVGLLLCAPYSVAVMIYAAMGYLLRSWRILHLVSSVFAFALLPVSRFLDESPRWLIQQGHFEKAANVLKHAATLNHTTIPSSSELSSLMENIYMEHRELEESEEGEDGVTNQSSLSIFFRTPAMRVISLVTPIMWFLMGVIYLGIPLNVNNFGSNPFIYLCLTGLMELAPTIVGGIFSDRFSRVPTMSAGFITAGVSSAAVIFVPQDLWWLRWVLVMVAMEMISTCFMVSFVWASELYPTVVRSRGCCSCSLAAHLGYFVTPFITEILAHLVWWLPNCIFGVCGVVAGLLVHLLPETRGLNLCETVQDVDGRAWRRRQQRGTNQGWSLPTMLMSCNGRNGKMEEGGNGEEAMEVVAAEEQQEREEECREASSV